MTWASGNSLELRAHNNITVATNATINATGAGALRLIANQDGTGGGDVSINAALTRTPAASRCPATTSPAPPPARSRLPAWRAPAGAVTSPAPAPSASPARSPPGAARAAGRPARRAGGAVDHHGATIATGVITASGSAGAGADMAGGNGGNVTLTSNGTHRARSASSRRSRRTAAPAAPATPPAATPARSASATSASSGNVATGSLTATERQCGRRGAAGTAGSRHFGEQQRRQHPDRLDLDPGRRQRQRRQRRRQRVGQRPTTAGAAIINTERWRAGRQHAQGSDAGNVTITGASVTMPGPVPPGNIIGANGGNALTLANARGGNAGTISVTATSGAG